MPINYKIEKKNFEKIRCNIGSILMLEFKSQATTYKNEDCKCVDIYDERTRPIQQTELNVINVSYGATEFDNKNQGTKSGNNTYFIDVYTNAKSTRTEDNDTIANKKLQRLMGIIDDIFENPIYKKLGFVSPIVSGHMIESMEIMYPKGDNMDGLATCFGRVTLRVRANENTGLLSGTELDQAITKVYLDGNENGFRYQLKEE